MSARALGRPLLDPDDVKRRLWDGISVYETEDHARRTAARFPRIGNYMARLHVQSMRGIRWERTTDSPGHYTLWGDPDQIANCVELVLPAR